MKERFIDASEVVKEGLFDGMDVCFMVFNHTGSEREDVLGQKLT